MRRSLSLSFYTFDQTLTQPRDLRQHSVLVDLHKSGLRTMSLAPGSGLPRHTQWDGHAHLGIDGLGVVPEERLQRSRRVLRRVPEKADEVAPVDIKEDKDGVTIEPLRTSAYIRQRVAGHGRACTHLDIPRQALSRV